MVTGSTLSRTRVLRNSGSIPTTSIRYISGPWVTPARNFFSSASSVAAAPVTRTQLLTKSLYVMPGFITHVLLPTVPVLIGPVASAAPGSFTVTGRLAYLKSFCTGK